MPNTLAFLFVVLAIGIILDFILLTFWVSFYFRFGLPLYILRFPLSARGLFGERSQNLETQQIPGSFYPTTIFKKISETEVAFKNKPLELKIGLRINTPYHGIIKSDPHSGVVTIIGYISWITPFFMIWALLLQRYFFTRLDSFNYIFLFLLVLFFVLILGLQVFALRHLGQNIRKIVSSESK